MLILALDLAKLNSVACLYDPATGEHRFQTVRSEAQALHELVVAHQPDRVVIEICPAAGWIRDLIQTLGVAIEVANVNGEAWRWQRVKRKTDRDDALKLARLAAMGQLETVHVPERRTRQWRALIRQRQSLIEQRTAIKNQIHALLLREGRRLDARPWTKPWRQVLAAWAQPLEEATPDELWRGQLELLLANLDQTQVLLERVEAKLEQLSEADQRTRRLRTIPGVGPRLAEAVVAVIDDPHRFASGRQVGAYLGLVPRQFQSGASDRRGRITGRGHRLLRSLLIEVAWIGLRYNQWMRQIYEQVRRGSRTRSKIAIVAVARRLLVTCWAMLRDGSVWREPEPAVAA